MNELYHTYHILQEAKEGLIERRGGLDIQAYV